ncbi:MULTISPECIES: HEPN domain-containing protein [Cyanophyceae]|uniref:HEPN domain-containing protein n=1 Tax=Leptolyngbya subtilissima DQ-A4 TaxID=2933933 RepID=A0ABV0K3H4_9CYAN|nr:HEPN domain-containing protein [Nodosilinea sp. FACHB-141]MBD2111278.1 hypothetical protein [Nodosilinea sp. FACHB-141]
MSSRSSINFHDNKKDIELLWHIHAELPGTGKKRRHKADVLNRSAIILISACWEAYIEDVSVESFDFLLSQSDDPSFIPSKVKALVSRELMSQKDERKIWELAGSGWKSVLRNHKDVAQDKWITSFNTPKSKQVRALFSDLLGISDITSNWTWNDTTVETVCAELDHYISVRGDIAHRVRHEETVHKTWGKSFLAHVTKLVDRIDEALYEHLLSLGKNEPW